MSIESGDDQVGQHIVAGDRNFLNGQHLNDFQQNQFGPELDADQSGNLIGNDGLRCFVERAIAEVA